MKNKSLKVNNLILFQIKIKIIFKKTKFYKTNKNKLVYSQTASLKKIQKKREDKYKSKDNLLKD